MVRVDVVDIPMPRIAIYIRNDCILYYFNSNKFDLQCAGARPNDDHIQSMGCNRSTQQQRQQQHTEGNLEDNNKKLKEKNKLSRRRRERTIFPHTYPQFSNLAFRWRSSMMHAYATMILSARYEICVCIKWWCSWPCPASACVLFFFFGYTIRYIRHLYRHIDSIGHLEIFSFSMLFSSLSFTTQNANVIMQHMCVCMCPPNVYIVSEYRCWCCTMHSSLSHTHTAGSAMKQ